VQFDRYQYYSGNMLLPCSEYKTGISTKLMEIGVLDIDDVSEI
jgi:hypothetical protein